MEYFALLTAIEKMQVPPVVCLVGEEPFLMNEAVKKLKAALLTRAKDFNFTDIDAKEKGVDVAVSSARQLPMMADRRVVMLSRVDELKGEILQPLIDYVAAPNPSTVLIMPTRKIDGTTKLGKALNQGGYSVQCQPLKRPELDRFVLNLAKQRQLNLRNSIVDELYDAYGSDLSAWSFALDRISLFLATPGDDQKLKEVDEETIAELVTRTRTESVFALTDAVLSGKPSRALPLVQGLLEAKEAPLAMLGLVARQVRQMLVLREAQDEGRSPRDEFRSLGIPPFAADKYLARVRQVTQPELRRALDRLAQADGRLKSSAVDDSLVWFGALWDVIAAV